MEVVCNSEGIIILGFRGGINLVEGEGYIVGIYRFYWSFGFRV